MTIVLRQPCVCGGIKKRDKKMKTLNDFLQEIYNLSIYIYSKGKVKDPQGLKDYIKKEAKELNAIKIIENLRIYDNLNIFDIIGE